MINAVGILFYSVETDRNLFLLRNDPKHPGCWGLPGGKSEGNETLLESIQRECTEELGFFPEGKVMPIEQFTSPDNRFCYHTFFCAVPTEFIPTLNNEHLAYTWIDSSTHPKPLHPGLWNTINFKEVNDKIAVVKETQMSQ